MASWCLATRQTPAVYKSLTVLERNEFIRAARRLGLIK